MWTGQWLGSLRAQKPVVIQKNLTFSRTVGLYNGVHIYLFIFHLMALTISDYTASNGRKSCNWRTVTTGRKWPWHNSNYITNICLERLRSFTKPQWVYPVSLPRFKPDTSETQAYTYGYIAVPGPMQFLIFTCLSLRKFLNFAAFLRYLSKVITLVYTFKFTCDRHLNA